MQQAQLAAAYDNSGRVAAGAERPWRRANREARHLLFRAWARVAGEGVVSLCGGKGQDLPAARRARAAEFLLLDISEGSVQAARARMRDMKCGARYSAHVVDCFAPGACEAAERALGRPVRGRFKAAVCNYALHYAWSDEATARAALANAAELLRRGGAFFGVTVDARVVRERRAAAARTGDEWRLQGPGGWVMKMTFEPGCRGYSFNQRDPDQADENGDVWQLFRDGEEQLEHELPAGELERRAAEAGFAPLAPVRNLLDFLREDQPALLLDRVSEEIVRTYCVFQFVKS